MSYERLPVEAFGRCLIETGDLDPVYIALSKVEWPADQRDKWLVAYWLFYHPGSACWLSDRDGFFWERVHVAAANAQPSPLGDRWPRASERRHFRGDKAIVAARELTRRFPGGHELVDFVAGAAPDYNQLFNRVCSLPQFGPWMAFKVADMLDRCCAVPVNFDLASVTMFDDPQKAALMVARENLGMPENAHFKEPKAVVRRVVEHLIEEFKDLSAPPLHDRAIGYQEVETVLCKWKSHMNGHYPPGKDIEEIRAGLESWSKVSTAAAEFLHHMPSSVEA